jgi:hydrogenase maturation protease
MNFDQVENLARAVLYEGYMLYPYRPSAVKNQQRFNFGVLYPQAYCEAQDGAEPWRMQTECLVKGKAAALDARVRFLHLAQRDIGKFAAPLIEWDADDIPDFQKIEALEIGAEIFQTWQEATERTARATVANLDELRREPSTMRFSFPASLSFEPIRDERGSIAGVVARRSEPIEAEIKLTAQAEGNQLTRVTINISNRSSSAGSLESRRKESLLHSMVSAHTILGVLAGEFVSLLDPPDQFREAAAACQNIGTWPVMAGEEGSTDMMLSSPIILYDYPQIAPESAGDLFDGTEIDEILSLRIMTLTDEEKREMRGADERARKILERTEALPAEQFMKMHGALRGLKQASRKA